jgi:hypothetical protein
MPDYDFSNFLPDQEEQEEVSKDSKESKPKKNTTPILKDEDYPDETRTGHKIVDCCYNCKYYIYDNNRQKNGYCRKSNPRPEIYDRISKKVRSAYRASEKYNFTTEEMDRTWLRTHAYMVCDGYEPISKRAKIRRPEKWIKRPLTDSGEIDHRLENISDEELDKLRER